MSISSKDIVIDQLELYGQGIIGYELAKGRIDYFLSGYFWDDIDSEEQVDFLESINEQYGGNPIINEIIHELENIPT